MEQQVVIQNTSDFDKVVYEKGTGLQWKIAPHQVRPLPEKIAAQMLEENATHVRRYQESAIPDLPGQEKVWIANNSGNPFLPDTVFLPGKGIDDPPTPIPNPKKIPHVLTFPWNPGQVVHRDATNGDWADNQVPIKITLLPGERYYVPLPIAGMITQRDGLQPRERAGRVVRCRAPSDFEPNLSWNIEDIYIYAHMLDPKGFSKDALREKYHAGENLDGHANILEDTKRELCQNIKYRLLDDQFNPPSREGFDRKKAEMAEKVKQQVVARK